MIECCENMMLTVIGTPYTMTYYSCMNCGAEQPRGMGAFHGMPKPKDNSVVGRLDRIERLLMDKESKNEQ